MSKRAHCILAVLGGVADIVVTRADYGRKALAQGIDHGTGIVNGQGCLADIGEFFRILRIQRGNAFRRLDQMDAACVVRAPLAHGAFHFRVPGMADQNHVAPGFAVASHLDVHLGHQWTGGIEHGQSASRGLVANFTRHTVRAEDHGCAIGHFIEFIDENRAARAQ